MTRYKVTFRYRDSYSRGEWRTQSHLLYATSKSHAESKTVNLYGLGTVWDYEIVSVEEI